MADAGRAVVLLEGRLAARDDGRALRSRAGRLVGRGVAVEILCEAGGAAAAGPWRVVEVPALGSRWLHPWAVRRARPAGAPRPALLHVLRTEMAEMGLALAERWGVPYLLNVEDFLPPGGRLRVSRRWCRGLVVPGADLAADLVGSMGVPEGFVTVVPRGLEVPDLEPGTPGPDAAARERRVPVVGAAGPLAEHSGLPTFLNAARRVLDAGLDVEFIIAGQGAGEFDLRRRAERLKLAARVTFAPAPEVRGPFWKVLDVFCQVAVAPTAGLPLATALAFGVPAVGSDVPGLRALVADGATGRLVPPGDSDALARALLALLGDPAHARSLGRAARAWAARALAPEAEADALTALYARVLGEEPSPASFVPPSGQDRAASRRS